MVEVITPVLIVFFINWIQCDPETETCSATSTAFIAALGVPILHFTMMVFWEDFQIGLKIYSISYDRAVNILFQTKKLRMSSSINNDLNEGEFTVLLYNDSAKF